MVTYLIATGLKPKANAFIPAFIQCAKDDGIDIRAVPNERFVNGVTMALQPAKWSTTEDPAIQPGMFEDRLDR